MPRGAEAPTPEPRLTPAAVRLDGPASEHGGMDPRTIRVDVDRPAAIARTRKGYYAGG